MDGHAPVGAMELGVGPKGRPRPAELWRQGLQMIIGGSTTPQFEPARLIRHTHLLRRWLTAVAGRRPRSEVEVPQRVSLHPPPGREEEHGGPAGEWTLPPARPNPDHGHPPARRIT